MQFFNRIAAFIGLLLLSPIFLFIIFLIRLDSKGSAFYKAKRVGLKGELFYLYKFRTMAEGSDKAGPRITRANDSRVTEIGRFLRYYKLDELPQLINVLFGEMNIVGPRPEDPRYVAHYNPVQHNVLSVLPGITGAASLKFRDEQSLLSTSDWEAEYIDKIMPRKLSIELQYIENQNIGLDLKIILLTLLAVAIPKINFELFRSQVSQSRI